MPSQSPEDDPQLVSEKLGQTLRELRRSVSLSQVDLAKALDVDQTAVSSWELGKIAFPCLLIPRIERVLGLPRGSVYAAAGLLTLSSVPAAIYADDRLDPKSKAAMIAVYTTLSGQVGGSGS